MAPADRSLSLVVPALHEEAVVEAVIERVRKRFRDYETILIDDGSSDCTGEIMDGFARTRDQVGRTHMVIPDIANLCHLKTPLRYVPLREVIDKGCGGFFAGPAGSRTSEQSG